MARPLLFDGCCCAGGAAKGYHDAGFEVIGVDIVDQPHYPYEFYRGDVVEFLMDHWREFDAFHVSPPCQTHSSLTKGNRSRGWTDDHPELIIPFRSILLRTGRPFVIENVEAARGHLVDPVKLCGLSFGLKVFRHRLFETSFPIQEPEHPSHRGHRVAGWRHGVKHEGDMFAVYGDGGGKGSLADWQNAMGIDWVPSKDLLAEAIPPAYTEYVGKYLMDAL